MVKVTYIVQHFVADLEVLGLEKVFKWLLFLTTYYISRAKPSEMVYTPVDIAELVLPAGILRDNCDIECSAC